jgi:NADPH-dependent FMN reductase
MPLLLLLLNMTSQRQEFSKMHLILRQDHMEMIHLMESQLRLRSTSIGMLGGARTQYHLRQMFVSLNMYPINRPEVIVIFALFN